MLNRRLPPVASWGPGYVSVYCGSRALRTWAFSPSRSWRWCYWQNPSYWNLIRFCPLPSALWIFESRGRHPEDKTHILRFLGGSRPLVRHPFIVVVLIPPRWCRITATWYDVFVVTWPSKRAPEAAMEERKHMISLVPFEGFLKWWYPQIIHFNGVFHYKPSILVDARNPETAEKMYETLLKNVFFFHVNWWR